MNSDLTASKDMALPMEVSDYLWSEEVFDAYEALLQQSGIDPSLGVNLSNLVLDFVNQEMDQGGFVAEVEKLGIESAMAKKVAGSGP